jgi:uncharacterized protein HemX
MARNRKNQVATLGPGPALKAALICSFIVICCVGYVWQKQQINLLADQIGKREAKLRDLRNQNDKLRRQLATLLSPAQLDQRVKDLQLGLGSPQPTQIWWLPEPGENPATRGGEMRYASARTTLDQ